MKETIQLFGYPPMSMVYGSLQIATYDIYIYIKYMCNIQSRYIKMLQQNIAANSDDLRPDMVLFVEKVASRRVDWGIIPQNTLRKGGKGECSSSKHLSITLHFGKR